MTTETNKPATAPKTPQIQPEATIPDTAQDTPKTQTDTPHLTTDHWTGEPEGVWTDTPTDSGISPVSALPANPEIEVTSSPNASPETAPKPKEQIISELAPKIQTTNMTPGRAMISAEQTYADAEKRFGANASAVLEQIKPGQEPRKFLDGFENAYLAGKMGNRAALKNSSVAAYLTEEQRTVAYELGRQEEKGVENRGIMIK